MDIFEKNLECITHNNRLLAEGLERADRSSLSNRIKNITTVETKTDVNALVICHESAEYRVNSLYNPVLEAERWAEQYDFKDLNMVISMFGFGNGTFVRAILKRIKKGDKLLVKEPSADVFLYVLNHYDITDILVQDNLFIGVEGVNDFEFRNKHQESFKITNIRRQVNCIHPQYDKIFTESCLKFWNELKDNYYHTQLNANTGVVFGKKSIENITHNLRYITNSSDLFDFISAMYNDVTAIIVSGGPSVQDNISELRRAKGKALILAVDRVLDYLLDNGVIPDFVSSIDPVKPIEYFTRRDDIKIPLLCAYDSSIEIMDIHKGKKVICYLNPFINLLYGDLQKKIPHIEPGSSVATFLFSICINAGFKRIVFVGQDMAYDGDVTHIGNVAEKLYDVHKDIMIEGISGEMIRSRYDWKEMCIWIGDKIHVSRKQIEIFDTKNHGAKIKGAILMPLKEILDSYCKEDMNLEKVISTIENTFSGAEMKKVELFIKKCYEELFYIKKKSELALKLSEEQIIEIKNNRENLEKFNKLYKKISRLNNYLMKQPAYALLDYYVTAVASQTFSELYQFSGDEKKDLINTYERSGVIFKAVMDAVDFIKPLLESGMKEMLLSKD